MFFVPVGATDMAQQGTPKHQRVQPLVSTSLDHRKHIGAVLYVLRQAAASSDKVSLWVDSVLPWKLGEGTAHRTVGGHAYTHAPNIRTHAVAVGLSSTCVEASR